MTEPAPKKSKALKNACVIRWKTPPVNAAVLSVSGVAYFLVVFDF